MEPVQGEVLFPQHHGFFLQLQDFQIAHIVLGIAAGLLCQISINGIYRRRISDADGLKDPGNLLFRSSIVMDSDIKKRVESEVEITV